MKSLVASLLTALLLVQPSYASSDCWNQQGLFISEKIDRAEKRFFTGDVKLIKGNFDYDEKLIRGNIVWSRLPNKNQTTTLVIGFYQNGTGNCVTVSEEFRMKGWTKKFTRNKEMIMDFSNDMLGTLSISKWTRNSVIFDWSSAEIEEDQFMGETCISVSTSEKGSWYDSDTTCITSGQVTTCQGPGWVSGQREIENVTAWARKSKLSSNISYWCTLESRGTSESVNN